jgi:midasin (ATPase involved in ribosome maturation)
MQADGTDRYLAAWSRIAPAADRLGDELLRVLVPRQRMRWSSGHAWGPRLDLRRAMQFEADPQIYRSLWQRPILPHRRDPAVLLLVDRSASMRHAGLIDRAFEGTVLLTEVCRRIGVPAAVWSFANTVREELGWDAMIDGPARRRLGMLPDTCDGNTDMAAALAVVGRGFAARRGDPKLLFVISDGEPDRHDATLAAVGRLEAEGIVTVGLGLGPGTVGLARFFPNAVTEIPPERLVDHVADLLGEALIALA